MFSSLFGVPGLTFFVDSWWSNITMKTKEFIKNYISRTISNLIAFIIYMVHK